MNQDSFWDHTPHTHSEVAIDDRLDHLEHGMAKMSMINRALWEILKRENSLRDDEIVAKVAEIDLRDGRLDDQVNRGPISCPSCGRKTSRRRKRCIYCCSELPADVFA